MAAGDRQFAWGQDVVLGDLVVENFAAEVKLPMSVTVGLEKKEEKKSQSHKTL